MIVASVVTPKLAEHAAGRRGPLRTGWPEHCSATMRLVYRDEQPEEEVPRAL